MPAALDVTDLRKQFGDLVAVSGVSFEARAGEVFGLLGPNGAGKSISGLIVPSGGRASVLGHDVARDRRASRQELGVVPQELALYDDLSARQNLSYWGAAYGMRGDALTSRVDEVLDRIGLADRAREPVKRFSGGMKRRLNVGCGLVHRPKVLLLDEPTAGVDPQSRVKLLDLVREEVQQGTCVLYTTHYMEEAQALCDRLAIIDRGALLATGTLDELRRVIGEKDIVRLSGRFDPVGVRAAIEGVDEAEVISLDASSLMLAVEGASRKLPAILGAVSVAGGEVHETSLSQPSLESLFIKLTGRALRD
jgi:ABC-2 type transport system ATP-binding protein